MNELKNINTLTPTNYAEWMNYATLLANSDFVPKECKGKPGEVLIRMQFGAELGLKPLQSVQNIGVINGKPTVYGDGLLAIVQGHPEFEYIEESCDEKKAICKLKRKNQPECVREFSIEDAKLAGLYGKRGRDGHPTPWVTYPKRMLQMRARGFAARDLFADALKGFITHAEAEDFPQEKYIKNNKEDTINRSLPSSVIQNAPKINSTPELFEEPPIVTMAQLNEISALITLIDRGRDFEKQILDHYKICDLTELTKNRADKFINRLNKEKKYQEEHGKTSFMTSEISGSEATGPLHPKCDDINEEKGEINAN